MNNLNIFGEWINNIDKLQNIYTNNKPYPHIIIDDFLNKKFVEEIYNEFPENYDDWHIYNNPIEVKLAYNKIDNLGYNLQNIFKILSSDNSINLFSKLSNINDLENDPTLHGAGLHSHPRNGRLGLHLDYEKHPILINKQRKLNIILYLSKNWKEEWNGETQLWNSDVTKCIVKSQVKFNRAVIFNTNELSWHGVPEKINCPLGIYRKSLAFYYISPLKSDKNSNKVGANNIGYREKATFINRPNDTNLEKIIPLYKIRPFRRITKKDIDYNWPEWNAELY
jgi:Rps23 Pro-64 3,4-dihydroxylase Tpa1-like proline 4-hydroxylase